MLGCVGHGKAFRLSFKYNGSFVNYKQATFGQLRFRVHLATGDGAERAGLQRGESPGGCERSPGGK